jgi:hypothetical protein
VVFQIVCPTSYVNSHNAAFALPVSDSPPSVEPRTYEYITLGPQNVLIQPRPNGYCIQTRYTLIVGWEIGTAPYYSKLFPMFRTNFMPPSSGSKLTGTRHTVGDPTFPGVERPGREVNHSPISSAEVRNGTVLSCEYRPIKNRQKREPV